MPNYSRFDVVLVKFPFSDLSGSKVRPAVVVNAPHISTDIFVVPLTSKTEKLLSGEFVLAEWKVAGLNVVTSAKRGIYTLKQTLVVKRVGQLSVQDSDQLEVSLRSWLGFN
ncbi:MAG TPA: type II toxin-antitoxin system PemK/MazF family toxin [Pyrinomonadaceae bacterium]|nr:type II toxin-antitoxin system PemK/MazF family toxin [Pyrinomonadaceae bacterium]HMP65776.1 type II toxin-antitoxin system PemK/MazF family toxin [Pyrinomonadaceae bacterium]